jgi:hypothetical protein
LILVLFSVQVRQDSGLFRVQIRQDSVFKGSSKTGFCCSWFSADRILVYSGFSLDRILFFIVQCREDFGLFRVQFRQDSVFHGSV